MVEIDNRETQTRVYEGQRRDVLNADATEMLRVSGWKSISRIRQINEFSTGTPTHLVFVLIYPMNYKVISHYF